MPSSVLAEPKAVWLALNWFVMPHWKQVLIVTDRQPLVFSGNAGYAKAFSYNDLLCSTKRCYPHLTTNYYHMEGKSHPSDEPSRGLRLDQNKLRKAQQHIINMRKSQQQNDGNGENGTNEWEKTAYNPFRSLVPCTTTARAV